MSAEKFVKVFQLAQERTKDRTLEWRPGPDTDEFEVNLANHTIRVWRQEGRHGFYVADSLGEAIGFVTVDMLVAGGLARTESQAETLMRELYDVARSKALKIDESLDALIAVLSEKPKS